MTDPRIEFKSIIILFLYINNMGSEITLNLEAKKLNYNSREELYMQPPKGFLGCIFGILRKNSQYNKNKTFNCGASRQNLTIRNGSSPWIIRSRTTQLQGTRNRIFIKLADVQASDGAESA